MKNARCITFLGAACLGFGGLWVARADAGHYRHRYASRYAPPVVAVRPAYVRSAYISHYAPKYYHRPVYRPYPVVRRYYAPAPIYYPRPRYYSHAGYYRGSHGFNFSYGNRGRHVSFGYWD